MEKNIKKISAVDDSLSTNLWAEKMHLFPRQFPKKLRRLFKNLLKIRFRKNISTVDYFLYTKLRVQRSLLTCFLKFHIHFEEIINLGLDLIEGFFVVFCNICSNAVFVATFLLNNSHAGKFGSIRIEKIGKLILKTSTDLQFFGK